MDTFFFESRVDASAASLYPKSFFWLEGVPIESVSVDKTYYVSCGRNTWHTTWARTYSQNSCFQPTFERAVSVAESFRKQGSKFYVSELPMLTVSCAEMAISVVEINAKNPFSTFSAIPLRRMLLKTKGLDLGNGVSLFAEGATMSDFLLAILSSEAHWSQLPSNADSVFVHVYRTRQKEYEDIGSRKLCKWRSNSRGANSPLDWKKDTSNITAKAMRSVIADAKLSNSKWGEVTC